jgi:hypothetical protein
LDDERPSHAAGTDRDRMPASEDMATADDAAVVSWTLWLRAGDLRCNALLARDRAGRGIAPESNIAQAAANEAISARQPLASPLAFT